MTKILEGKCVAEAIFRQISQELAVLTKDNLPPKFAMVRVGSKSDDLFYEQKLKKSADSLGIDYENFTFLSDITKEELLSTLKEIGERGDIHGIIPFLPFPLPDYKEWEKEIKNSIPISKDIDCVSPQNAAKLYLGEFDGLLPATPQAVMEMLKYYEIPLKGKSVVIVGCSMVVGKPLALLMLNENATVSLCHIFTTDLPKMVQSGDVIISAIGKPCLLTAEYFKEGQIVIDVGINKTPQGYCGDVDFQGVSSKVMAITPSPGGVGSITTAVLLHHVVKAYKIFLMK